MNVSFSEEKVLEERIALLRATQRLPDSQARKCIHILPKYRYYRLHFMANALRYGYTLLLATSEDEDKENEIKQANMTMRINNVWTG